MNASELVVVFNAINEVHALLYRTMLEEAGIDVIERPLESETFEGVEWRGLHSQLLVRREDADKATTLIAAFRKEAEDGHLSGDSPQTSTDASAG